MMKVSQNKSLCFVKICQKEIDNTRNFFNLSIEKIKKLHLFFSLKHLNWCFLVT